MHGMENSKITELEFTVDKYRTLYNKPVISLRFILQKHQAQQYTRLDKRTRAKFLEFCSSVDEVSVLLR